MTASVCRPRGVGRSRLAPPFLNPPPVIQPFQTVVEKVFVRSVRPKRSVKFPFYCALEMTYLLISFVYFFVVIAAMVRYLPPFPSVRGPSGDYSIAFVKSPSGILKIVEMVRT